jgi:phosphoribosylformylglycinamidine synthase subunit PurS
VSNPDTTASLRARIHITLRPSILDPQGKAIAHAVGTLNIQGVHDVRMGKYIEVVFDGLSKDEARQATEEMCRKLLANPVMENFTYEIVGE